jgi:hypothetical protein
MGKPKKEKREGEYGEPEGFGRIIFSLHRYYSYKKPRRGGFETRLCFPRAEK